jgi:hypothetical protein
MSGRTKELFMIFEVLALRPQRGPLFIEKINHKYRLQESPSASSCI